MEIGKLTELHMKIQLSNLANNLKKKYRVREPKITELSIERKY